MIKFETLDAKALEAEQKRLADEIAKHQEAIKNQGLDRKAPSTSQMELANLNRKLATTKMKLHAANKAKT